MLSVEHFYLQIVIFGCVEFGRITNALIFFTYFESVFFNDTSDCVHSVSPPIVNCRHVWHRENCSRKTYSEFDIISVRCVTVMFHFLYTFVLCDRCILVVPLCTGAAHVFG